MIRTLLNYKNSSTLLLLVMVVLPVSVSTASMAYLVRYDETVTSFTWVEWSVFYFVTSFTMALALTPTTFIALVTGYFIGWKGLYGLVPSYIAASMVGYYLASRIDQGKFFAQIGEQSKTKRLVENLKTDEFWVIFFCRISPALPFAMMNVLLSFMKVKIKNFLTGSIAGMLPRTLLSVWIGTQASDLLRMLKGKEDPSFSKILIMVLLVFSVVGLYAVVLRAVKRNDRDRILNG